MVRARGVRLRLDKDMATFFTDTFGINPEILDDYGAFDISIVNDLPLFIDPFLLFHSEKPDYQALHRQIINYLIFCVTEPQRVRPTLAHSETGTAFPR